MDTLRDSCVILEVEWVLTPNPTPPPGSDKEDVAKCRPAVRTLVQKSNSDDIWGEEPVQLLAEDPDVMLKARVPLYANKSDCVDICLETEAKHLQLKPAQEIAEYFLFIGY